MPSVKVIFLYMCTFFSMILVINFCDFGGSVTAEKLTNCLFLYFQCVLKMMINGVKISVRKRYEYVFSYFP